MRAPEVPRSLRVVDNDDTVVDVVAPSCGGDGEHDAQAVDALVAPVIAAIPDWDDLVAEGT